MLEFASRLMKIIEGQFIFKNNFMNTQKNLAQISRTRNGQFKVRYYGVNGKLLSSSEANGLKTYANAKKNIIAMGGLFNQEKDWMIEVLDLTKKPARRFFLKANGEEDTI